jgi:hypothetical protein
MNDSTLPCVWNASALPFPAPHKDSLSVVRTYVGKAQVVGEGSHVKHAHE